MAFEGLGEKLQNTFKKLRGKGKLSEKDIKEAMREVKLALLEAELYGSEDKEPRMPLPDEVLAILTGEAA
jgi:hypothetical protein